MTLSFMKVVLPFVLLVTCTALFALAAMHVIGLFSETSYKVTAAFLFLILYSNVCAKICIYAITRHETRK